MIKREIKSKISAYTKGFPVVGLVGPRQSGKTTLLKNMFPEYEYYNLERPSTLSFIQSDPNGFINSQHRAIIDEVQRMPELLSYIQATVDERQSMGDFIISGSENLLISEKISQSLAGRAAYATLLPLSLKELADSKKSKLNIYGQIWEGFYPALYSRDIAPNDYYDQYIATYVERDLKNISNIKDLSLFRKFLALLAGRIGQLINYQSLANAVGVSPNTIEHWISILETCYIVMRLHPYHDNFGKRYIKSSKIYFVDTGLACYLLNINNQEILQTHYLIGGLFENMCIMDLYKRLHNSSAKASLYFFRDRKGNEVDLIIDTGQLQIPLEIKSSSTFSQSFSKGIKYWNRLQPNEKAQKGFIIYNGNDELSNDEFSLINWRNLNNIKF